MKAHTDTTERKKRVMDVGAFFVSHAKASVVVEPGDGALDVPAQGAEAAAVFGVASRDERAHFALKEFLAMGLGIVSPIRDDERWFATRTPAFATDGGNGVDEGNQLGDVVPVCAGDRCGKRNSLSIGNEVVLGARLAPVRWIRAGLVPPKTARTLDESTRALPQSIWSAPCSLASSAS